MLVKPNLDKPIFSIMQGVAQCIRNNECPTCGSQIIEGNFRTQIDKDEYTASGMCQACIDSVFNTGDD